ncbi:MAG: hypothetical protein ACTHJW_15495 [Streptosporangiaceae bacterium]
MANAAGSGDTGHEPTLPADDIREHERRLRGLPVDQLLADVMFSLLHAADVKLGRRDARLLIDVTTVAHGHVRPYLPEQLAVQIDLALGQLRLGQVNAERRASSGGEPAEENDLDRVPAPPNASAG